MLTLEAVQTGVNCKTNSAWALHCSSWLPAVCFLQSSYHSTAVVMLLSIDKVNTASEACPWSVLSAVSTPAPSWKFAATLALDAVFVQVWKAETVKAVCFTSAGSAEHILSCNLGRFEYGTCLKSSSVYYSHSTLRGWSKTCMHRISARRQLQGHQSLQSKAASLHCYSQKQPYKYWQPC